MSNTDFQKVIEFAEGTLDPVQEDELFLKLSADEELRQEFKSHMSIKNAVRTGAAGVVLPAASKAAVFSKLGLQIPAAATAVSVGTSSAIMSFLLNKKTAATTVSLAVVSLILLISTLNNDSIYPHNGNFDSFKTDIVYAELPVVSSFSQERGNSSITDNGISESVSVSEEITNSEDLDNQNEMTEKLLSSSAYVNHQNQFVNYNSEFNHPNINNDYPGLQNDIQNIGFKRFSLELRSSNYFNSSKPTISPQEYSSLNNLAVSLMYNANRNLSIGADVRQETFFLQYQGIESGEEYLYEQQPNFTTFSGLARYKLDSWNGFRPFGQVSAGFNSIGLVSRAMMGLEYSAFNNFSFMLSVDFNNLTYTHQNNYFNSSKFGLNYGLVYSF